MKTKHAQKYRVARFVLSAFCLTATLMPLPALGADYGIVKGKITDKADGEGVYGASVSIAGTSIGTTTDMNGNFTLSSVPAKQQKISISIVGYAPASQVVTVANGQTYQINLQIGQTTIMASEVVVGASLYKQNRLDVPVTANVVSQEKIKQQANPTLDRIIEDVPGVVVTRAGGQTSSGVQVRGSNTYQGGGIGTRVSALYDGFPINAPESGEVAWSSVNMNAADKVEILKGAAATLYGSSAMGGVVNVFGHLPDKLEVKAGLNGGFYAQPPSTDQSVFYNDKHTPWFWNTYVGFGNKSGKLNYNILYTSSTDDGYRQNANTLLDDIKLKARYDIDASQYLLLSAFYNQTKGGYAYEWYTGDSFTVFTAHPERAYDINNSSYYYDDMIKRKNALVGLNYVNLLGDNLSLDTKVFYTHNATRYEYNTTSARQLSVPIPYYNKAAGDFNETYSDRIGVGAKLDWRANDNNRVLFGAEGSVVDVTTTQLLAQWPTANTFGNIKENNRALFVQDELKLTEKLTSLLSLRYDWSGINADIAQVTSATGPWVAIQHKSVDAFSPRVALNFKAMDDMSLRASWGKSFRAPSLYERFVRSAGPYTGSPNAALDKETMTAYEVGMFKEFGDQLSLDIAGFLNNYDNLIESVISPGNKFEYQNITKARIYGIETGLNYRPASDWAFNVAYTYMVAKNRSYVTNLNDMQHLNPDPFWLPYRPEHTASAGATWKPTGKLSLNVNGRYVSQYKSVSSHPNSTRANYPGDFVIFNTGLKYQAGEAASVSLLCKNINNTQYEEAEWFRAPGRSYVAGVDFTF